MPMPEQWPMFQRLDAQQQRRIASFWQAAFGMTLVPGLHLRAFLDGPTDDDRRFLRLHRIAWDKADA